jgi:hypothetical protein
VGNNFEDDEEEEESKKETEVDEEAERLQDYIPAI